ncbi:VIN3-like protein 2 [Phalaenopsis equestris]|uniref:VIN3-like protein 2 n=1 Tax=Phalaenopsis equestris TaxID=78828 RepID=UPI0009E65D95|nr:VIN3-like protein 2 [Phalaenopsis equestris]
MDPPFFGYVLDPSKCQKLSIREKREIVWQLAKWPESAPEKLQTWSRRDLLQILCVEMGKERKYTGLTKHKLIENLFKIVSEKKSGKYVDDTDSTGHPSRLDPPIPVKRQRKNDHPSRLPVEANVLSLSDESEASKSTRLCLNVACRAPLSLEDLFCKRCSCCICHNYDDNKDPSLWLFCSSEDLSHGVLCGLSCHLDCALKDERTGMANSGQRSKLDGSYCCVQCRRVNSLLGCWRKQLIIAKDARRVDVLCHRVSLSHKLLNGTQKFQKLHEIVDEAMKMLESEVGLLLTPQYRGHGIVNRLTVGAEVQRLCARAIETVDTLLSSAQSANLQFQQAVSIPSEFIKFEDKSSSSLIIVLDSETYHPFLSEELFGYKIWHRKVDAVAYPAEPTCRLYKPNRKFLVTGLVPGTEYIFKVIAFSERVELGNWEVGVKTDDLIKKEAIIHPAAEEASPKTNSSGLSNPSSEADESHNTGIYADLNKSPGNSYFGYREKPEVMVSEKSCDQIYSCKEMDEEERPGLSGSALDEEPNSTLNTDSHRDSNNSTELNQPLDIPKSENASTAPIGKEMVLVPCLPATAGRLEAGSAKSSINLLLGTGIPKPEKEPGSSSKKRSGQCDEFCQEDGPMEGDYEYCVKVIRWLECDGYIESNFRVKFLTWFSLRATLQERRVVSVYVDTLIDDPGSLAGQLVDTFSDAICSKRPPPVPNGFCMKLWH